MLSSYLLKTHPWHRQYRGDADNTKPLGWCYCCPNHWCSVGYRECCAQYEISKQYNEVTFPQGSTLWAGGKEILSDIISELLEIFPIYLYLSPTRLTCGSQLCVTVFQTKQKAKWSQHILVWIEQNNVTQLQDRAQAQPPPHKSSFNSSLRAIRNPFPWVWDVHAPGSQTQSTSSPIPFCTWALTLTNRLAEGVCAVQTFPSAHMRQSKLTQETGDCERQPSFL